MRPPAAGTEHPETTRVRVVIGALMLVMLLSALDQTIVSTALPTIVGDLGGLDHLSWVVTAYLLALTVVTPLYGKLGDLYGRKIVLQGALVIFLIGSALCGLAQGMAELIAFRALQGLGGGGLMVGAQAAIGDVVSPRERGRYMGLFGAVFGVASVAGPLLGGFLTSNLSWRWIFYVNLPLGVLALGVLAVALPSAAERVAHRIDYLGAGLLAAGLSALVLLTTLGGNSYAWDSAFVVGLGVLAVAALVGFVAVERRASEPVLPPQLFRNRVFNVTSAIGFVIGLAMFGALTYLPLFQQVVRGQTPTESGLQLVPLMAGLLVASIGSGQIITRTGRYKPFPIAGTAIAAIGMLLLSGLDADTTTVQAGLYMLVFGFGLGLVMQVLVLAVQNAVPYEQLGVATSAATLFRSIGGSLGTAILGAIFSNRLASELASTLPTGAATDRLAAGNANPAQLGHLPAPLRNDYVGAFTDAFSTVFLIGAAIVAVAFLLTWLLEERPLRQTVETAGLGEAFAAPFGSDSLTELSRKLARLVGRERTRRFIEGAAARAGVDLPPLEVWLLARIARHGPPDIPGLVELTSLDEPTLNAALAQLAEHDLTAAGADGPALTPAGLETFGRLTEARDAALRELVADWEPEGAELDDVVVELAQELELPAPVR